MAKGKKEDSPCSQTYGFPIYGAAWVSPTTIGDHKPNQQQEESSTTSGTEKEEQTDESTQLLSSSSPSSSSCLVFCGGGGEGRSGIANSLLLAQFDSSTNSLSPSPIAKLGTGDDLPYRMAVHPKGDGVICSFPQSCRFFEWDVPKNTETHNLGFKASEKVLTQLEDVGQQLALTFSVDGSALAVGGEDGHLRVFKWPSMEVIFDQADAYSRLKDLSFSYDAKFLVSLGNGGPCRVWDVPSSTEVATLPKENDEVFGFCRFSQISNDKDILYIASAGGSILSWETTSWRRVGSKHVVRDPISAFSVSADGKFLAVGTIQGDIFVVSSANMRVLTTVKKAHLGLVTALTFSTDSRYLVSASLDSTTRVTPVEDKKQQSGFNIWIILFIVLLAIVAYFLKEKGIITY